MRIIFFAWTAPALLASRKTVTRRSWSPRTAAGFHAGDLVQAYDRSPRHGGKKIALIRLTRDPYLEHPWEVPDEDWEAEGFAYLTEIGASLNGESPAALWKEWKESRLHLASGRADARYVVRFELVEEPSPRRVLVTDDPTGRAGGDLSSEEV